MMLGQGEENMLEQAVYRTQNIQVLGNHVLMV